MRSFQAAAGLAAALVLSMLGQPLPAHAAELDSAGEVTVKRATSTSLTLTWRGFEGARNYVVERATDLDMSPRRQVLRTDRHRVRVSGLEPGGLYCFQVRAVRDGDYGPRSRKVCQRTIAQEGDSSGQRYRVVTYNICSSVCADWSSRRAAAAALVAARRPDVVMLQEATAESGMAQAIGGMVQVQAKSGKALLFRRDRFDVAVRQGARRTGIIDLGAAGPGRNHRYAVWAELVERDSGQHVVFVGLHLAPSNTAAADAHRGGEVRNLLNGLARVNPGGLPVVVAGDFNSHQGRTPDTPGAVMSGAGFANSYFRAHRWVQGKLNSANGGKLEPRAGSAWGYHLDQVWAEPGRTQVLQWRNAAKVVDGRYAAPLPSNHNPVLVKLRVND